MAIMFDRVARYPDFPAARGNVLLISCVDFRLLDDLVRFMDHENLTNRYYHFALAGASLAFHPDLDEQKADSATPLGISPEMWRGALRDHLKLTLLLTQGKLSDIYIIEHRDCGAYKHLLNLDFKATKADILREELEHSRCASALNNWLQNELQELSKDADIKKAKIAIKVPAVRVMSFLMDLRGHVKRLPKHSPLAADKGQSTPSSHRRKS